jgi:hypothetical protein
VTITPFSSRHPTHKESLWRFVALVTLLAAYFLFMVWKYDAATGAWLSIVSWSFFVLCTPIADGGFIVAFPLRLLFGVRMIWTQIVVWFIALGINVVGILVAAESYDDTVLTRLLAKILTTPWPYWSILAISAAGTGFSIWFGDEMIDVTTHDQRAKHHRHGFKHRSLIVLGLGVLSILAYYQLLSDLQLRLPGE